MPINLKDEFEKLAIAKGWPPEYFDMQPDGEYTTLAVNDMKWGWEAALAVVEPTLRRALEALELSVAQNAKSIDGVYITEGYVVDEILPVIRELKKLLGGDDAK